MNDRPRPDPRDVDQHTGSRLSKSKMRKSPQSEDHTPFFGAPRLTGSRSYIKPEGEGNAEGNGPARSNEPTGYQRQSSRYLEASPAPRTRRFTTARHRRSVTGRVPKDPTPANNEPHPFDVPEETEQKRVACAVCGQPFMVQRKDQPYTVICIHCGQLNRIMPG
ncbi:MAG: hypothetical protein ACOCYP_08255 [Planctomycetota bacterium]